MMSGRRAWCHGWTLRGAALGGALGLLIWTPTAWGQDEFDDAEVFFELNDTDGDFGIHSLIDGDAWQKLEIRGPNGALNLKVKVKERLRQQGLTEFFFESAEPEFSELPPAEFFERFPEGEYTIIGTTLEGDVLKSTTDLTHLVPAPPANVQVSGESIPEDCDEGPVPAVGEPVVISWDLVTLSHAEHGRTNEPIEVDRYQVVVEQEDLELSLSVELPPDATSFTVPADFIALGDEFKFEILVREASGNQTAMESCFEID